MSGPAQPNGVPPVHPDTALARRAVEDGIHRYFATRRERVGPFVDRHFSFRGSARLHRAALGWDIARAPLNLFLAGPQVGLRIAAAAAAKLGAHRPAEALRARTLLLKTRVATEIEWLVTTELLELPCRQHDRVSSRDALAEIILADEAVTARFVEALQAIGRRGDDPAFRQRLEEAMGEYASTRAAASEIAAGLVTLGTGALTLNKLTPGAVTLGPALAGAIAHQAAIAAFPFGQGLGGLWYALFPVAPSAALIAGLTGGLMLGATILAAFAGLATDPLQRRLGLHRKRLLRMIEALEQQMFDPAAPAFTVHDHYVARLLDLFDLLGTAWRIALR